MKLVKVIFTLIFLLCITSCGEKATENGTEEATKELSLTNQQIQFNGIEYADLVEREFSPEIFAFGKVEVPPQNKTIITAKFGGFVKSIDIIDGMKVRKGQKLIEIEDPSIIQMQQDYLENLSNMEYLKAEFERQETLSKEEATSLKNFQQAKSNYLSSKAKNLGLRSKLKLAGVDLGNVSENGLQNNVILRAPFDGIVTKVNVQTGSYVNSQDQLLELIDTKHAHAEISVYEKDIYKLKQEQNVKMIFPNIENPVYGKIYLIGHDLDKDKTVKVHCHFNKENSVLIPGSFFKAIIKTQSIKNFSLPTESIVENKGENYIFLMLKNNGKSAVYEKIKVNVISKNDEFTAISFENINQLSGKKYVSKGAYELFSKTLEE